MAWPQLRNQVQVQVQVAANRGQVYWWCTAVRSSNLTWCSPQISSRKFLHWLHGSLSLTFAPLGRKVCHIFPPDSEFYALTFLLYLFIVCVFLCVYMHVRACMYVCVYLCICVCVCVVCTSVCIPWHTCRGQGTTCRTQFPSTVWDGRDCTQEVGLGGKGTCVPAEPSQLPCSFYFTNKMLKATLRP